MLSRPRGSPRPLWSLLVALLCSDLCGLFGHQSLTRALYLPMIVTLATGAASSLATLYLRHSAGTTGLEQMRHWFLRLTGMQLGISLAWGFMPWLLWEPGNPVNHIFLAACTIAVISGLVAARGSNMAMFVASLVPISVITAARFALGRQRPGPCHCPGRAAFLVADVVHRPHAGDAHA